MPWFSSQGGWPWADAAASEPLVAFGPGPTPAAFLAAPSGVQSVACRTQGSDLRFRGQLARVHCPQDCQRDPETVAFGAGLHPMRSSVCLAAVVDQVLPLDGGEVIVSKVPGVPSYTGKDIDYAQSLAAVNQKGDAFHMYATDSVTLEPAFPPEARLNCRSTFALLNLPRLGNSKVVQCPGDCGEEGKIVGASIYAPDSSICRAASHAGVIGSQGGHVMVTKVHGQEQHYGAKLGNDASVDGPKSDESYTVALPTPDVMSRISQRGIAFL